MYTIYALVDPRDQSSRYIGITEDVYQRMRQHSRCEGNNERKNAWIKELQKEQLMFIMHSLEKVKTVEQALEREQHWIQYYLQQGANLTNRAGISASASKPLGPKWILSPEEAKQLFFKTSTGQIVNVPDAPSDEFDRFVKRYVQITESTDTGKWDKVQKRQVLSHLLKHGIYPAFCNAQGEPLSLSWPDTTSEGA
jgi:predicted GIY-YIG superfamily endonuclease